MHKLAPFMDVHLLFPVLNYYLAKGVSRLAALLAAVVPRAGLCAPRGGVHASATLSAHGARLVCPMAACVATLECACWCMQLSVCCWCHVLPGVSPGGWPVSVAAVCLTYTHPWLPRRCLTRPLQLYKKEDILKAMVELSRKTKMVDFCIKTYQSLPGNEGEVPEGASPSCLPHLSCCFSSMARSVAQ